MVAIYINNIPQSSHHTAFLIDCVRRLYLKVAGYLSGVKNAIIALVVVPFIVVASVPFLLILLFAFKLLKFRLKYSLKKDVKILLSNYKEAKDTQSSLRKDLSDIQKTIDVLNGKSLLVSTIFINDIKDTHTILSLFSQKLDNSLANLSESSNNGEYFTLVSEQTLWNNRVESYQYRL